MKKIRTVNGVSQIGDDLFDNLQVPAELINVLNAHRDTIVKHVLGGLEVYIRYKFDRKLSASHLDVVKGQLADVKSRNVDFDLRFSHVLQQLRERNVVYVGMAPVMDEIDEIIQGTLSNADFGKYKPAGQPAG
ncbi:MAG: hypothetical protein HC859_04350 [Bacteroidia bacterium]|nr:hypothetical protein [Bacteroidia bacterium]